MRFNVPLESWTQNRKLIQWVQEQVALCQPAFVHLCDGSEDEFTLIADEMVRKGTLVRLKKRPGSFWCRSHPDDVARVEESTFICSKKKEEAGPTNNWRDPTEMKLHLDRLFRGCMRGRTMYVLAYCMGPVGSPLSRYGVEATDSPYVVLNMYLMTRMGPAVLQRMVEFVPGLHSVGVPLTGGPDVAWPCNPQERLIVHFPEERSIFSFGSGYGGNALLGKKCYALRIASVLGRDEGWLAEHMLILGLTNPQGVKRYVAASFPSACGKTNLAMLTPTLPGWQAECVGDDIAWMHIGPDGRLYAINPEAGYFGVAPGTSMKTNPNAMRTIERNTIFTNVALTDDGDVWWEGMGTEPPKHLTSWLGKSWTPGDGPAAHPNARFTVAAKQNPMYDMMAEAPEGVPLSALLFGGRRKGTLPLAFEARSWNHGVLIGASLSSETTAAAKGTMGVLRHDPFAMLPFCGYNMGDYFKHWIETGRRGQMPRIYGVNWFGKDEKGNYLWPGFGDNVRVLEWIFARCEGRGAGRESPIGILPQGMNLEGLKVNEQALLKVDPEEWRAEVKELERYFGTFRGHFPSELAAELSALKQRLA